MPAELYGSTDIRVIEEVEGVIRIVLRKSGARPEAHVPVEREEIIWLTVAAAEQLAEALRGSDAVQMLMMMRSRMAEADNPAIIEIKEKEPS